MKHDIEEFLYRYLVYQQVRADHLFHSRVLQPLYIFG